MKYAKDGLHYGRRGAFDDSRNQLYQGPRQPERRLVSWIKAIASGRKVPFRESFCLRDLAAEVNFKDQRLHSCSGRIRFDIIKSICFESKKWRFAGCLQKQPALPSKESPSPKNTLCSDPLNFRSPSERCSSGRWVSWRGFSAPSPSPAFPPPPSPSSAAAPESPAFCGAKFPKK